VGAGAAGFPVIVLSFLRRMRFLILPWTVRTAARKTGAHARAEGCVGLRDPGAILDLRDDRHADGSRRADRAPGHFRPLVKLIRAPPTVTAVGWPMYRA
jgi:hypothetical protein